MESFPSLLIGFVGLALFFAFTNGINDSANQVATVISSRALPPEAALTLAAIGNFIGASYLGTHVARTIAQGIVHPVWTTGAIYGLLVLMSAVLAAVSWNIFSWFYGFPSSSWHAMVGGLLGAFVAAWGFESIRWSTVRTIVIVMLLSPILGFLITYFFTKFTFFLSQWASPKANEVFKKLQVLSLLAQSIAHGTSDAQKTMGILVLGLTVLGRPAASIGGDDFIPRWVLFSSAAAISLGTLIGGWRIIKTLGAGFYRVRPIHGFGSQTAASAIIYSCAFLGFPVSTTEVISSSVMGAGAAYRPKAVRWELAGEMVIAWLITIPASALVAALACKLIQWLYKG